MQTIGEVVQSQGRRDYVFEAVLKGRHGITYQSGMDLEAALSASTLGQLRREVTWWKGRYADPDDKKRIDPPENATPENILAFFSWWRLTFPDATAPEKREAIVQHWANWELARLRGGRRNSSIVAPTDGQLGEELRRFDSPEYRPLTAEEKADWLEAHRPRFGGNNE